MFMSSTTTRLASRSPFSVCPQDVAALPDELRCLVDATRSMQHQIRKDEQLIRRLASQDLHVAHQRRVREGGFSPQAVPVPSRSALAISVSLSSSK